MDAIGGYFELELRQGEHYHKGAILLNTARNCFEYVLLARKYRKIYIPYYTCDVMLQPLRRYNIAFEFYSVDEKLEPVEVIDLLSDEAYLYTNYYGLKQCCVEKLALIYGSQLIIDNAQAFFAPRINSIDTFYSPRKFFGVSDGGYLYTDCILEQDFVRDKSYTRMRHLLQRIDEGAESSYPFFRSNDDALDDNPIRQMSYLTQKILCNIDYEYIKRKRKENFQYIHMQLKEVNKIELNLQQEDVPMVYPFYVNNERLRNHLIENEIFIATYWSNVLEWCDENILEYDLSRYMLPLPIDQRYIKENMDYIVEKCKYGK